MKKQQTKKPSKKQAKKTNWIKVNTYNQGGWGTVPDGVKIRFYKKNSAFKQTSIVTVIGIDLLAELGWKVKDRIEIFYNEFDHSQILVCKTSNGSLLGYNGASNSKSAITRTAWPFPANTDTRLLLCEHEVDGDKLIITLDKELMKVNNT